MHDLHLFSSSVWAIIHEKIDLKRWTHLSILHMGFISSFFRFIVFHVFRHASLESILSLKFRHRLSLLPFICVDIPAYESLNTIVGIAALPSFPTGPSLNFNSIRTWNQVYYTIYLYYRTIIRLYQQGYLQLFYSFIYSINRYCIFSVLLFIRLIIWLGCC